MDEGNKTGRIWVHEFDHADAQKFCDAVLDAAQESSAPIPIFIQSDGGRISGLAAMLSVMDSVPNDFITICPGTAQSAGAVLLSHGDTRCVGPHASVMIHEASSGAIGNVRDMKVETAEIDRLNASLLQILAANTGVKIEKLRKLFTAQREVYLSPEDVVKFGIADHIGVPMMEVGAHLQMSFVNPKKRQAYRVREHRKARKAAK